MIDCTRSGMRGSSNDLQRTVLSDVRAGMGQSDDGCSNGRARRCTPDGRVLGRPTTHVYHQMDSVCSGDEFMVEVEGRGRRCEMSVFDDGPTDGP